MPYQYTVPDWLNGNAEHELSFQYWNDKAYEKMKAYNIQEFGLDNLNAHLAKRGLAESLEAAQGGELSGLGVDVACGTFWSAKILVEKTALAHIWGVDFSRHRITMATYMLATYDIPPDKASLAIGNFYDLHFEDRTVNLVLLSQALHHAARPADLLHEVKRILVDGGIVILTGEKPADRDLVLRKSLRRRMFECLPERVRMAFPKRRLLEKWGLVSSLPSAPDPLLGDHYYNFEDYEKLFSASGFQFSHGMSANGHDFFLLWKKSDEYAGLNA